MPSARSFDAELAALEALRGADPATTEAALRRALAHRNNFLVTKAAKLCALHSHRTLVPELVTAFTRFLANPASDPQCWAKNALAETLTAFDYQEPELFFSGMKHIQLEPVWGGTSDTAGTLRGRCALALVACRGLRNHAVLVHLTSLFADKELSVRVNAARAVEQIGSESAALLLRLRAELASDEPELLGACYTGVLRLEGPSSIPWVAQFLRSHAPDDASAEAAFAIAETRTEEAFTLLRKHYEQAFDPDFRTTLLTAIALTRQDAAIAFLFSLIEGGNCVAAEALEVTGSSSAILERLHGLTKPRKE